MPAVTKLSIAFLVDAHQTVDDAIHSLPNSVQKDFVEHAPGDWQGDLIVSCSEAPHLAEGDFTDDLAPHFPALLHLQKFYHATFELQIAVGAPGPEVFELPRNMVAMMAALGATLFITTSTNPSRVENGSP